MKKRKFEKLKLNKTRIVSLKIGKTVIGGSYFNTCAINVCLSEVANTYDWRHCTSEGYTLCGGC